MDSKKIISDDITILMSEATEHSKIWFETMNNLEKVSKLDKKTFIIANIAVISSLGITSGIPFRIKQARKY